MVTDRCLYSPTVQINKIVPTVTYHSHYRSQDDDQLQADKLAVSHYIVSCARSLKVNSIVRTTSTLYLCSICVCACSTTVLVVTPPSYFLSHPFCSLPFILLSPIYPARISLGYTLLILPLMYTSFLSRNGLGRTMFLRLCSETTSISLNMWRS